MKNKMKIIGAIAVIAIIVYSYVQVNNSEPLDDFLLENIEALAAGESGTSGVCVGSGSVVCPLTKDKVEHVYISYSLLH